MADESILLSTDRRSSESKDTVIASTVCSQRGIVSDEENASSINSLEFALLSTFALSVRMSTYRLSMTTQKNKGYSTNCKHCCGPDSNCERTD